MRNINNSKQLCIFYFYICENLLDTLENTTLFNKEINISYIIKINMQIKNKMQIYVNLYV